MQKPRADRAAKIACLLATPEVDLLAFVAKASRAELIDVYRLGLVCRCEPLCKKYDLGSNDGRKYFKKICHCDPPCLLFGLRSAHLAEDGTPKIGFVPCPHLPAFLLPGNVQHAILCKLWPRQYADLPLDSAPSNAITRQERFRVLVNRARRRKRLFHPDDARQIESDGLPDSVGVKIARARNGDLIEVGVCDARGDDEFTDDL